MMRRLLAPCLLWLLPACEEPDGHDGERFDGSGGPAGSLARSGSGGTSDGMGGAAGMSGSDGGTDTGGIDTGGNGTGGNGTGGNGTGGNGTGGNGTGGSGISDVDAGAELDAGTREGGDIADAGPPPAGIACVVIDRNSDCVSGVTSTFDDVPFEYFPDPFQLGPVGAVTSDLAAFERLFNGSNPNPMGALDAAGATYGVLGGTAAFEREGAVLTANFVASRQGNACIGVPGALPLVSVSCSGSTLLAAPTCLPVFIAEPVAALECSVTRRDETCAAAVTSEVPQFWLASGAEGPEGELQTNSPSLTELFGANDLLRFFKEGPCDTYVPDIRSSGSGTLRFERSGNYVQIDFLGGQSSETCEDALGDDQPTLVVTCSGRAPLAAEPLQLAPIDLARNSSESR